ncbi:MAG: hypothetical protein KAU35_00795 [candidate division Zixibacteria bacterium]|nr:hypothetical protein [candidate division Zixibacteria bacterium]
MTRNTTKQIGQLFMVGFPGTDPPAAFLNFIGEEQIGGVILFGEACATHQTARRNIERIRGQYAGGTAPFIAIDQEGGRICRLKGIPVEYRAAAYYCQKSDIEHFAEDYRRAAVFMESVGINLNLAPVADIFMNPDNSCLRDRCFGETAEDVARYVERSVVISREAGILSCLKHFPGLGPATLDPHEQTAAIPFDEVVWRQRGLIPFTRGVEHGADMIMTTHVRLDGFSDEIATGSKKVISTLLRRVVPFDGPAVTDDLTMKGAAPLGSIGERAVAAFKAGHDILLFGQDFEAAMRAYDYFHESVGRGEIDLQQVQASLSRVSGIKFKLDSTVMR